MYFYHVRAYQVKGVDYKQDSKGNLERKSVVLFVSFANRFTRQLAFMQLKVFHA